MRWSEIQLTGLQRYSGIDLEGIAGLIWAVLILLKINTLFETLQELLQLESLAVMPNNSRYRLTAKA